jgi:hypothetical protein
MSTAPLLEAVLGLEDRAGYLRDLQALVALERVQLEDEAGMRACTVDEVFSALEAGRLRRALICYRYGGTRWFDTLRVENGALHLVRVEEAKPA